MKDIVHYDCFIPLSVQNQVIFKSLVPGIWPSVSFDSVFTVDGVNTFLHSLFFNARKAEVIFAV